jgi:outer membrane autotransporter protein
LVAPATFANAVGTTDSTQAQAGANFTAELASHSSLRLSAIGGVHYIGLNIDGYTETGAGALSAVLPDREIESLKTMLGGQIDLRIASTDSIVPFVRVQWAHEFSDDGLATSAAFSGAPTVSFTSPGPELGEDWATLGAGFSGRLSPRTNVYVRYQGDFGRDGQDNHGVSAAARFAF